jgi:hypothetical protein
MAGWRISPHLINLPQQSSFYQQYIYMYFTVGYDEIPFWFISSRFPHLRYCKHNTDFPIGLANIPYHQNIGHCTHIHEHTQTHIS